MLRVGLVGCGTIGTQLAFALQRDYPHAARITALHDVDRLHAAALQRQLRTHPPIVTLPQLMKLYGRDFGTTADRVRFAASYVPELREMDPGHPRIAKPRYGRFDCSAAPQAPITPSG